MIKKVEIQNFKCLIDVRVDLGPFNVLIGPNDSGKTSFLEVIGWLNRMTQGRQAVSGGQVDYNRLQQLVWQKKADRKIGWRIAGDANGTFEYFLEISPFEPMKREVLSIGQKVLFDLRDGARLQLENIVLQANSQNTILASLLANSRHTATRHSAAAQVVADTLTSTEEYHFAPGQMRSASPVQKSQWLNSIGSNLAGVLHGMLIGPDRQAVVEMEKKLSEAIPTLQGFSTPPSSENANQYRIEYTLAGQSKPPITIPASQVSDGALLLTAFLALAYGDTPQILLIEEPENGLHPSMLKRVIELLRKMSTGEIGNRARQVILTTHSPLLLNFLEPEEVRIFRRTPQGGTEITPMSNIPNIENLQKEFAPGELWYLFGEEKLLEGQPA